MPGPDSTIDLEYSSRGVVDEPCPGALLVYTVDAPKCGPIALKDDALVLGRGSLADVELEDLSMSRRHAKITYASGKFEVADLGSRNGLVLDGVTVPPGGRAAPGGRVLRIGRTVFVLLDDLRAYLGQPLTATETQVVGPILARCWDAVDAAAKSSGVLHLYAESGAGKELAARRFHAQGPSPKGPFVAVNCAAIPEGVAERLLFGARKGAYSGANSDVEGYFEAAHGGSLFLDEVGELGLEVQAKLLRTIETREVLPLGASKPRPIDVRLVSATHVDLRRAVGEKRFRGDLFFRLCRPTVKIPPLRERPEEIGYLAALATARIDPSLRPSAAFVEACLLREWPGNVRELTLEVSDATRRSQMQGQGAVEPELLDPEAGRCTLLEPFGSGDAATEEAPKQLPADDVIEQALRDSGGRVATAARNLGVHRTQLRRWLAARDAQATEPQE